jgi:hypothetical protein
MISQKRSLLLSLENNGILIRKNCTNEENLKYAGMDKSGDLPTDVFANESSYTEKRYYKLSKSDLTDDDITTLISLKKVEHLKKIKDCMIYFVIISILSIIIGIIVYSQAIR